MRAEIQKLHRRLQTTTVYVTHDQTEAMTMTMATRLVVMKDGLIQQVGTPKEVYDEPDNMFVGGFLGSPSMNFLDGHLIDGHFAMGDIKIRVPENKLAGLREQGYDGNEMVLGIRPEDIHDEPLFVQHSPQTKIRASVDAAELMGAEIILYSKVNEQDFVARVDARFNVQAGQTIDMAFDMEKVHFFDQDSEVRIR